MRAGQRFGRSPIKLPSVSRADADNFERTPMSKEKQIANLEKRANREGIDASDRLALIYKIYELRGIPKWVYSGE